MKFPIPFELFLKQILAKPLRIGLILASYGLATFSILFVLTLIDTGKAQIKQELASFGPQNIWIWRDPEDRKKKNEAFLTSQNELAIREMPLLSQHFPNLQQIAACLSLWGKVTRRDQAQDALLYGVTPNYFSLNRETLETGRTFEPADITLMRRVCLLPEWSIPSLYPHARSNPLGTQIQLLGEPFTVIGVLKQKDSSFLHQLGLLKQETSLLIYLPLPYLQRAYRTENLSFLQAETQTGKESSTQYEAIEWLKKRREQKVGFKSESLAQYLTLSNKIMHWISLILFALGSVSLFVSGCGTANLLLLSIAERKTEIGIKKALGARQADIFKEFLCEALMLGSMGAMLGLLLSFLLFHFLIHRFLPAHSIPWQGVIVTFTLTFLTTLGASLYPATKGAQLNPITALKQT